MSRPGLLGTNPDKEPVSVQTGERERTQTR
jgi:hypothetical protein